MRLTRDGFTLDDDPTRLWPRLGQIATWLADTYWAGNRDPGEVVLSWENAGIVLGLYENGDGRAANAPLVGCSRAVTDFARFAYLSDVYVHEPYRGLGLGTWMVETMLTYPDLERVRWLLDTRDAHEVYRRFGFVAIGPTTMERRPILPDPPRREGPA